METKANIHHSVEQFYILSGLSAIEKDTGAPLGASRLLDCYAKQFAVTLHDYLVTICIGEARHAERMSEIYCPQLTNLDNNRDKCYEYTYMFDPKKALQSLCEVFSARWQGNAYGGNKWLDIAQSAMKFYSLSPICFIDSVINKEHNTGQVFNKSVIFETAGSQRLKDYLDFRRNKDIFADGFDWPILYGPVVKALLDKAQSRGLIGVLPSYLEYNETHRVTFPKPIEWGFLNLEVEENNSSYCDECGRNEADCTCLCCRKCGCKVSQKHWCSVCHQCQECCDCLICDDCGVKVLASEANHGAYCFDCEKCEECCDCETCDHCGEKHKADEKAICEECGCCEDCCECKTCKNCEVLVTIEDQKGYYCNDCKKCKACCTCKD